MKGFFTTDDELNKNNRLEEKRKQFMVEFNRYYFTKQYEKAFDFCINSMADEENKHFVYTKAMLAIEKLTNRIELSDVSRINQDWVIDKLVNYGHKNMKVNGDEIKVGQSKISVIIGNNVKIEGKSNISNFTASFIAFVIVFIGYMIAVWTIVFSDNLGLLSYHESVICGIFIAFWFVLGCFYYFYNTYIKGYRTYIRDVATFILYEYNKE